MGTVAACKGGQMGCCTKDGGLPCGPQPGVDPVTPEDGTCQCDAPTADDTWQPGEMGTVAACKGGQMGCCTKDGGLPCGPQPGVDPVTPEESSKPYDCEAGYSNWEAGWSEDKKSWCCSNEQKGCPETTTPPAPPSEPYDCNAGYSNWEAGWSPDKKEWCCANKSMGCAEAASKPFDCDAGYSNWEAGWSEDKKGWCCTNEQKGCPK